jgi:superfamily II DNA or RNA helicase
VQSTGENLRTGAIVWLRGRRWSVAESTRYLDCWTLRLSPAALAGPARTFLLPFDRPYAVGGHRNTTEVVRPRQWLRTLREKAMDVRPFGGLTGAVTSSIDLLPYQLEPALAMRRHGYPRVMIADAVGLGKTIQAGLIVRELSVERESFRALIVTPAGLRDQWAAELGGRFSVRAEVVTSAWLARAVREIPSDVGPWALPGVYLCSFEYLRRPEVLRPLEDVCWDLLVVDEAHAATPGTARLTAVHAVALRSRRVVLLTATPHGGDDEQFRSLCRIGRADERPDPLLIFCRSRADIGTPLRRRTVLLPVRPSAAERRMHRLLEGYAASVCAESRASGNGHARLAAIVLRKRALSSAGSLAISCRRRLALLAASHGIRPAEQLWLPLDAQDPVDDLEPDAILGTAGLADAAKERRWLERIVDAADVATSDESKIALLRRLLRRVKEPIIVFTEFRDTLARLETALSDLGRYICRLHGGMPTSERSIALEQFRRGDSLLLATDAAAEGLNLHSRCRTVLHFELPWSPSRLEQRTGRVDRIGQRDTVHEIMLVAADTAERLVLAPLAKRAARARRSVPHPLRLVETLSESRVAAAVMDGAPIDWVPVRLDPDVIHPPLDLQEYARLEAVRLGELRRGSAVDRDRRTRSPRVCATLVRAKRGLLPPGLLRIFRLELTASDGRSVHSELVVLHQPIHEGIAPGRLVDFMKTTARNTAVAERLARPLLREHIAALIQSLTGAASALADRESVVALPATSAAQRIVQAGLFDRRAVRSDHERHRTMAAVLEDSQRRIEAHTRCSSIVPSLALTALIVIEDRGRR